MSEMIPSHEKTPEEERACRVRRSLGKVMRTLVFGGEPDALAELPILQVRCLHVIRRHEGMKMQELALKVGATLPAMSQIVDRLVKRDLVERRADPHDRRVVRLHITESAQKMLRDAHQQRTERLQATLALLDEAQVERVVAGLTLLADAAMQARPESEQRDMEKELQAFAEEEEQRNNTDSDTLVDILAERQSRSRRMPAGHEEV